jgi:hypothetical protein
MFQKLFRKKSQEDRLQIEYNKLMQESYRLSSINRSQSDRKYAEAQKIADEIEHLRLKDQQT